MHYSCSHTYDLTLIIIIYTYVHSSGNLANTPILSTQHYVKVRGGGERERERESSSHSGEERVCSREEGHCTRKRENEHPNGIL